MKISLKDGSSEPVVVFDTNRPPALAELDECATCERNTPTLIVEGEGWAKVEICPDCLIKALAPVSRQLS